MPTDAWLKLYESHPNHISDRQSEAVLLTVVTPGESIAIAYVGGDVSVVASYQKTASLRRKP